MTADQDDADALDAPFWSSLNSGCSWSGVYDSVRSDLLSEYFIVVLYYLAARFGYGIQQKTPSVGILLFYCKEGWIQVLDCRAQFRISFDFYCTSFVEGKGMVLEVAHEIEYFSY